jgi:aspartate/methionine/tyrosine aminotransferase
LRPSGASSESLPLAERVGRLSTESAFEVLRRAHALEATGRHVIHLEIGQPDFPTPAHISQAAYEAIRHGATGYSQTEGLPALREAIADYVAHSRGVGVSPANVAVTPGAKPILFFALLACVEPGDEVLCPDPGFPIYASVARFVGATPVPLPLREEMDFRFDVDDLRQLVSPRTRMLILNSPHNPTGGVLNEQDISAVADVVRERDMWVMSDEVYAHLLYDGRHASILSLDGMQDRTILVDGVSKTYSMTGWRLGWGVMPERVVEAVSRLMVNSNSCTATFTQHAAIAALNGPQDSVAAMRDEFRRRRDLLVQGLNAIPGIQCRMPSGAFYAFPNVTRLTNDDRHLSTRLLEEAGVATLWGSSFGAEGAGYLRLSYATSYELLQEAVRRIGAFVERM